MSACAVAGVKHLEDCPVAGVKHLEDCPVAGVKHLEDCPVAGVIHLEDCPVQPFIPIYLLVGGCFGLLKVFSLLWRTIAIATLSHGG
jgi:hypothetical protein